jgi:hypothetical protein
MYRNEVSINPDISKNNFYLASLPEELKPEMATIQNKLDQCLQEFFTKYVRYEEPKTEWEEANACRGPRESLHVLLEVMKYFSYPSPVSILWQSGLPSFE